MPIYEYHCQACKSTREAFRSVGSRDRECPCDLCGGPTARAYATPPAALNTVVPGGFDSLRVALGESFDTAKQVDKFCESRGLERVDYYRRPAPKPPSDLREEASRYF